MPLNIELSFIVQSVRRNNGVMDTLFSLPGGLPDEYVSANLLRSRGVAKEGQRYKIIIVPEFPVEQKET